VRDRRGGDRPIHLFANKEFSMRYPLLVLLFCGFVASEAMAQFTGPSVTGRQSTVEQAREARLGSYVTVTGQVVAHLREDYFTFRDQTGEIRVEIGSSVWRNRPVSPDTKVRLLAEVDQGFGGRYLWVKSLEIVE
jgi:uncharacterized protein (TIGR00156 family)